MSNFKDCSFLKTSPYIINKSVKNSPLERGSSVGLQNSDCLEEDDFKVFFFKKNKK
jgi:hypothetical protein